MVPGCLPSTWEAETGEFGVRVKPGPHSRHCLKKHTKQQKVHVPSVFLRKNRTLYISIVLYFFESSFTLVVL